MAGLGAAGSRAADDRPQRADRRIGRRANPLRSDAVLWRSKASRPPRPPRHRPDACSGRNPRPLRTRRGGPHRTRQMHHRAVRRRRKAASRSQGKPAKIASVADAIHRHGIGYVSEDRKAEGLILMHSVLDNAGITVWRNLGRHGLPLTDGRSAAGSSRSYAGWKSARLLWRSSSAIFRAAISRRSASPNGWRRG